ncbi:MAG: YceI family protein [Rothia sp. (in: high G+C Gram-positive bacteria)]|uniref:YceI family protein n=1 Tax=Rothia sp. (in: high G+C Gram-positive bacteria) TaxID=1885016 RepID=UPI0026FF9DDB|nr:YceI family protein [Rothia sp. (in: high G+C Gram-positive bacteria)]
MENKSRIALWGAGALVVLGGAAFIGPSIYASQSEESVAEAPSITMSAPAASESPTAGTADNTQAHLAGTWQVSEGSQAGYRVDEVLNGENITVTGRTSDVTGTIKVNDKGTTLESASFTVDVTTIATDSERRDNYFRENTVKADQNPTATLNITQPVELGTPAAGETITVDVTGELTLAGVTQTVTFPVQVAGDGSQLQIAASVPLTFADYGIEAPSLGFVSVEETGAIEVQLTAVPAA